MEWTQEKHPLTVTNGETESRDAKLVPSGNSPHLFNGLSRSARNDITLLDGLGGKGFHLDRVSTWYSVGYRKATSKSSNIHGNPAYLYSLVDAGKVASP